MRLKSAPLLIILASASLFMALYVRDVQCRLADPVLTFDQPVIYRGSPVVLKATIHTTAI